MAAQMTGNYAHLISLIEQGREVVWYNGATWQNMREQVLKLDNYECQLCKAKGRHSKAIIVHHVKHLKDRPDLAVRIWDGKERQLTIMRDDTATHMWKREATFTTEAQAEAYIKNRLDITGTV